MKCKNCGAEFNEGIFCPECGTKNEVERKEITGAKPQQDNLNGKQYDIISSKDNQSNHNKNTMAIVSLIAGIVSIITLGCWVFPEIIAIVCGLSSQKREKTKAATGGIICGIIATVLFVIIIGIGLFIGIFSVTDETSSTTEVVVTETGTTEANITEVDITEASTEKTDKMVDNEVTDDNEVVDSQWYYTYTYFYSEAGAFLQVIYYDDGSLDFEIDGVTAIHYFADGMFGDESIVSDGLICYNCNSSNGGTQVEFYMDTFPYIRIIGSEGYDDSYYCTTKLD